MADNQWSAATSGKRRTRPQTLLWCETCEEYILRSNRVDHPHELRDERDITEEKPELSDDCNISTQTYDVEFVCEYREVVRVEASNSSEARTKAQHKRTYNGEYIDTIHTETRTIGDESIASLEYLEYHGLLPDDHTVTPDDLKQLAAQNTTTGE